VDACASSRTTQAKVFYSGFQAFRQAQVDGERVLLMVPFRHAGQFVRHYLECKQRTPSTTGVLVLPKLDEKPWWALTKGMQMVGEFPVGSTDLFKSPDPDGQGWIEMPPLKWPVVVLFDPPGEGESLNPCGQLAAGGDTPKGSPSTANLSDSSEDSDKENRPPVLKPETCSLLRYKVHIHGRVCDLVVDSGAAQNFVQENTAESLNLPIWDAGHNPVEYADGRIDQANRVVPVLKYRIGQLWMCGLLP
jgi:hypothetical protein